jgi:uncharacterized membrane protein YfcA
MGIFFSHIIPSYFQWWHLPIVFLAGLVGEGYGVVVGSGGVLIQFVLLSLGIPLPIVVATDIAGCLGSNVGVITASPKHIWTNKKLLVIVGVPFFIGGVIGTFFLTKISPNLLSYVVICGLFLLLIYIAFVKKATVQAVHKISIRPKQIPLLSSTMVALGLYGNVSGIGVGTFQKISYSSLLKISIADGIGITNIVGLPPTAFSFVATTIAGLIAWPYLIMLWLGNFIGSHLIAKQIRKIPNKYLQVLLILVTLLYLIYLIWSLIH